MSQCQELIAKVRAYLAEDTHLVTDDEGCVISFPLLTADHRRATVYVKEFEGGFRVHDGGDTLSQLYVQGIHSETRVKRMAARLGVVVEDGVIALDEEGPRLVEAVLRLVQAQTVMTTDLLLHDMSTADHPRTQTRVARALHDWKPAGIREIKKNVEVRGLSSSVAHRLDYVAFREDNLHDTVAVKLVPSTHSPKVQLERYGFLALDLEKTDAGKWSRLAVITRGDRWRSEQLESMRKLSKDVLVLNQKDEARAGELVKNKLTKLALAG